MSHDTCSRSYSLSWSVQCAHYMYTILKISELEQIVWKSIKCRLLLFLYLTWLLICISMENHAISLKLATNTLEGCKFYNSVSPKNDKCWYPLFMQIWLHIYMYIPRTSDSVTLSWRESFSSIVLVNLICLLSTQSTSLVFSFNFMFYLFQCSLCACCTAVNVSFYLYA